MVTKVAELVLTLEQPEQLSEHILRESGQEALFVPGYDEVPAGADVSVLVKFPGDEFRLLGRVTWRRTQRGGRSKQGLQRGVGITWAESQAEAVQRLYAYAEAPKLNISRRESKRMTPTVGTVRLRYGSLFSLARDFLRDVSLGGLRIVSDAPPGSVGDSVTMYLRPPRALTPIKLDAEIVWITKTEFGVRFTRTSSKDKRRLSKLIERLTLA
jgi:PilZ domain